MCQEGIHLKDELEACFIELPSVLPKNKIRRNPPLEEKNMW
jgi:hypothetical protein